MAKRPRICGKMFHQGQVFDVCTLEHKHEPPHRASKRGFTFSDEGGIVEYDKPFQVPRPALDTPIKTDSPGTMLPEPPKLDLPTVAGE